MRGLRFFAKPGDVPKQIANRYDADRLLVGNDRQMPITADVHLVEREGQTILGGDGFGIRLHLGELGGRMGDPARKRRGRPCGNKTRTFP